MRSLSSLVACMLLALILGLGSVAHAAETVGCTAAAEAATATAAGHADGDEDQVPGDSGKPYTHHHASCHGHHLASPCAGTSIPAQLGQSALPARPAMPALAGAIAHPVLHPPQA